MKKVYVQKEVVSWEEYVYNVPDDFQDYHSLVDNMDWTDWEYLADCACDTGKYEIRDSDFNLIEKNYE